MMAVASSLWLEIGEQRRHYNHQIEPLRIFHPMMPHRLIYLCGIFV
jgi:hypothetical protein